MEMEFPDRSPQGRLHGDGLFWQITKGFPQGEFSQVGLLRETPYGDNLACTLTKLA